MGDIQTWDKTILRKLILLDEATAAMDYRMERAVMDLLKSYLQRSGAGVLLITHQPSLASTLDRIFILEQGKISTSGTPAQLLATENPFSAAYQYILQPKTNPSWQD